MLLEKLKQHGGKIMFFVVNLLVVVTGVMLIKQKNVEQSSTATAEAEAQNYESYKAAADYAAQVQQQIIADKEIKVNSVASNPDTIKKEQTVPVTKTIPAVTKTVTVKQPSSSSSSSSSAKTTTKKS